MDSWTDIQYGRMVRGGNGRWRDRTTMTEEEAGDATKATNDDGGERRGEGATGTDSDRRGREAMRARYEGDDARAYRARLSFVDGGGGDAAETSVVPPGFVLPSPPPGPRRVAPAAEERPPTFREAYDLVVRTAFLLARRSRTARRAALAYATVGTSIAWGARAYVVRRATAHGRVASAMAAVSSSLPSVNPAAARAAVGAAIGAARGAHPAAWWDVGRRPNLAMMCAAGLLVGVPWLLFRRFASKIARTFLDNRQEGFKSAGNHLADLIGNGRARRLRSCDAYYPAVVAPAEGEEEGRGGGGPPLRAKCGLVFFPGALVDRTAYAPVASLLSDMGVLVAVVNLEPHRFVPTLHDYPLREVTMRALCDSSLSTDLGAWTVDEWAVGGHSLGGHLAIAALSNELSSTVKKVVLWGVMGYLGSSYPYVVPLREIDGVRALVVNGSNDGIIRGMSKKDNAATFEARMPPRSCSSSPDTGDDTRGQTTYVTIEGGNHSGYAHYGPQTFPVLDGTRTITMHEQQQRTAEVTADFLLGSGSSRMKSD
jgi:hypothetical protein